MSARAARPPHQSRPNRRYRRLLPTALAVAALAATGSTLGASPARAAGGAPPPQRAHHHAHPSRAAIVPRTQQRADTAAAGVTGT
jgi:Spy/CpxP family protein refolding chaperone